MTFNFLFFLLSFLSLLFSIHAKRHLHPSDTEAFTTNIVPKPYILAENESSSRTRRNHHSPAGAPAPGPAAAIVKQKHKKIRRKLAGWILGFIVGAFTTILSAFVFSLLFNLTLVLIKGKGKGSSSGLSIYSSLINKAEDLAFLEKEDSLASLEIIGKGGCGVVYKADLPGSNGKMIAIKEMKQLSSEEDSKRWESKMMQMKAEIDTVGLIRHRNVMPLLAHISRPGCHYLVYEFMKKGSLQDMLTKVYRGDAELDWLTRHWLKALVTEDMLAHIRKMLNSAPHIICFSHLMIALKK